MTKETQVPADAEKAKFDEAVAAAARELTKEKLKDAGEKIKAAVEAGVEKRLAKEVAKATKSLRVLPKAGTNPLTLKWPVDPLGALKSLKKGGIEAARRVKGDEVKLANFVVTLKTLEAHAKARFVEDTKAKNKAVTDAVAARARVAEKQKREAEAKAAEYEAAAKRVRKQAGLEE